MNDVEIKDLENKIGNVQTKINEIDTILSKLEKFENRIKSLEVRIKKNEESISETKKSLENDSTKLQDLDQNFYILLHAVDDLEKASKYLQHQFQILSDKIPNFKCDLCDQGFTNKQTLTNHIQRNHLTFKT